MKYKTWRINYNLLWYHDVNPFEKISCSFSRIFYHVPLSLFLSLFRRHRFSRLPVFHDKKILLNVNQVPLSGVISILVSLIIKRGGKKAIKIDPQLLNWLSEEKFGRRKNFYYDQEIDRPSNLIIYLSIWKWIENYKGKRNWWQGLVN